MRAIRRGRLRRPRASSRRSRFGSTSTLKQQRLTSDDARIGPQANAGLTVQYRARCACPSPTPACRVRAASCVSPLVDTDCQEYNSDDENGPDHAGLLRGRHAADRPTGRPVIRVRLLGPTPRASAPRQIRAVPVGGTSSGDHPGHGLQERRVVPQDPSAASSRIGTSCEAKMPGLLQSHHQWTRRATGTGDFDRSPLVMGRRSCFALPGSHRRVVRNSGLGRVRPRPTERFRVWWS